MTQPPAGTVTFLFTDIEGSTQLWQQYPKGMPASLARHHALLNESISANGGYVFQIIGDAFCAAFSTARAGLDAALAAQRALQDDDWGETGPIRVRMALHTGPAQVQAGLYTSGEYLSGLTLSRAARLLSAGHGGQILLSLSTAELVRDQLPAGISLRDLGARRLKDLVRPEQIYQAVAPDLPVNFAPLKTLDVHSHNLPVQLTSFIGREREMVQVKVLLKSTHLLTLTGVGGAGKTRLALQVAADLIDEFPDGVWLVQLAPLADPSLVPQAVATVWGVHEQSGQPISDLLENYVLAKRLLLVMDNCEHVVDECALLAGRLLRCGSGLKILATSREVLNLAGEATYPVPPLSLPDLQRAVPASELVEYEAVRLFIERASAAQPAFSLTETNTPAVTQICWRLDGIPLAIELAAARVRALSPELIAERLADRFNLLTGGSRIALPRQRTLRAALDWSYDLLTESERQMLNQLAVFPGSFSLEAVEAIYETRPPDKRHRAEESSIPVIDLLIALVDKSMVVVEEVNAQIRYRLLETVRQYAFEKLEASGEAANTQARHLAYYLDLAEQGAPHTQVGQPDWMARFETEYDNFRTAMEYAISQDPESALQLASCLSMFSDLTSRVKESYAWALRILAQTESWLPGKLRAKALWLAGDKASVAGDFERGQPLLETSLEMATALGDKQQMMVAVQGLCTMSWYRDDWKLLGSYGEQHLTLSLELDNKEGIADSYLQLGAAASGRGEYKLGRSYFEQSLSIGRQENLPNIIAFNLRQLGLLSYREADYQQADKLFTECAQIRRQMGHRAGEAITLVNLGQVVLHMGECDRARLVFQESLGLCQELERSAGMVASLAGLAAVAGVAGEPERAAKLFGAVEAAYHASGSGMNDLEHRLYDPIIATARDQLGEAAFTTAWEAGRSLTLEQALEYIGEAD